MRKQYHFRPAASGSGLFDAWDVDRLIVLSAPLPVEQVEVASIAELDTNYWSDGTGTSRTVRQIVEHARLILDVEVDHPVIISWEGRVMDGMHRIARAVLEGRTHVRARQFAGPVAPDYVNVRPNQLSYER